VTVPPELTYLALFFGYALEGTSLPVPAELLSLGSGHYISLGLVSFWGSVVAAAAGNVTGSLVAYAAGWLTGRSIRRGSPLARLLGVNRAALERAEPWLRRFGGLTTFAARWIGFIRPAALMGAGAMRVRLPAFLFFGALGSFTYCLLWQYLGWRFAPLARHLLSGHVWEGVAALVLSIAAGVATLRLIGRQ